ncbi:tetratricopeptide repeat protein [Sphingomonas sp. R647]|uniref:tetratricopeptide repeat protein n=1 Tax=Sphingomonas sp. R647 TaxID=2875233 RepID=UPI001CD43838|nr:tetratricopeptide repeat protein [Sphingomonas sp. R647]MCA1199290.1 tetratricopeptide repeat protein [Sphingomonas sp. R647]
MHALLPLLLLATPTFAAERAPVPARATLAQLEAAHDRCKAATPNGDRCLDLQLALARALIPTDPDRAAKIADRARLDLNWVFNAVSTRLRPLHDKVDAGTITPAEQAVIDRAGKEIAPLWLEMADVNEIEGDAGVRGGTAFYRASASRFLTAVSIRRNSGTTPAHARAQFRAAAKQIDSYIDSPGIAEALPVARQALIDVTAAFGANDPATARIVLSLADVLTGMGQTAEAEPLYDRALAGLATQPPEVLLDARARKARFLAVLDRSEAAEQLHRAVVADLLKTKADPDRIARAYIDLAPLVAPSEGLTLASAAITLRQEQFGAQHVQTARAKVAYARLLDQYRRPGESAQLWREAIPVLERHLQLTHPETATAYLDWGYTLLSLGDLPAAEATFATARKSLIQAFGKRHPLTGRAMMYESVVMMRLGKGDWLGLMRAAVDIVRETRPATHMERVQAELAYAGILLYAQGDAAGALAQLRIVTRAGLDRSAAYRDFGSRAQKELRDFGGIFALQVRAAWDTAAQQKR